MLDKVRECSAQPEEAAAFFGGMLWPVPEHRLSACGLQSDYLKEVYLQMQTDQAQPQNATGSIYPQFCLANLNLGKAGTHRPIFLVCSLVAARAYALIDC